MTVLTVVLSRADNGGPELRSTTGGVICGVATGKSMTHVILKVRRRAIELSQQTQSDSGRLETKW